MYVLLYCPFESMGSHEHVAKPGGRMNARWQPFLHCTAAWWVNVIHWKGQQQKRDTGKHWGSGWVHRVCPNRVYRTGANHQYTTDGISYAKELHELEKERILKHLVASHWGSLPSCCLYSQPSLSTDKAWQKTRQCTNPQRLAAKAGFIRRPKSRPNTCSSREQSVTSIHTGDQPVLHLEWMQTIKSWLDVGANQDWI